MDDKKPNNENTFFFISIIVTILLVIMLILIVFVDLGMNGFDISRIGNYLSGVVSPFAFYWIIYSNWISKKSIDEANNRSFESYRLSKDQHDFHVEIEKENYRYKHNSAQPFFISEVITNKNSEIEVLIKNNGEEVIDFTLTSFSSDSGEIYPEINFFKNFKKEQEKTIYLTLTKENKSGENIFLFPITFIDKNIRKQKTLLKIEIKKQKSLFNNDDAFTYKANIPHTLIIAEGINVN